MNAINTFSSITEMQVIWAQNTKKVIVNLDDLNMNYQKRVKGTDLELAQRYAESMEQGAELPPILVFEVEGEGILVDGYTRVAGYKINGVTEVEAVLYEGRTKADAELFAAFANNNHGKRASNEDNSQTIAVLCKNDHDKVIFFKNKYTLDTTNIAKWVQCSVSTVKALTVSYRHWLEAGRDMEVTLRKREGEGRKVIASEMGIGEATVSRVSKRCAGEMILPEEAGNYPSLFDKLDAEDYAKADVVEDEFNPYFRLEDLEEDEDDEESALIFKEKLKKLGTHIAKGEALIQRHMAKPDRPKAPRKVQSERDKRIEEAERNGRLYVDAETFTANFSALVVNLNGYEASQNDPMLQSIISRIADNEFYTNDLAQLETFFTALKQGLDAKRKAG